VHTTSIVRYNWTQNKACCINLPRPEMNMSNRMITSGEIWAKVYELNSAVLKNESSTATMNNTPSDKI